MASHSYPFSANGTHFEKSFDGFELIARLCPDNVLVLDRDGCISWSNPAFLHSTGFNHERALGSSLWSLLAGDQTDHDRLLDLCLAIEQGGQYMGDQRFHRQDGSQLEVTCLLYPVKDSRGKVNHFIVFLRDLTEQRKEQEKKDDFMFSLYRLLCEKSD